MSLWKTQRQANFFLSGIRAALPLASEQITVMITVIRAAIGENVSNFLDLGCGDGILGRMLIEQYPQAKGVFLDFSEPMLEAAYEALENRSATVILQDFSTPDWASSVKTYAPFDVVVSGYAIHHIADDRKQALYRDVYNLLAPGGIFLNMEHVATPTEWVEQLFEQSIVDGLSLQSPDTPRESIEDKLRNAPPDGDILASVEDQCNWLREIGYKNVDCFMKIFALAIFGGMR